MNKRKLPTEPGFYWVRYVADDGSKGEPFIAHVITDKRTDKLIVDLGYVIRLNQWPVEWYFPKIEPPKR